MCLIRQLFFIAAHHNFDLRLIHVPGIHNVAADLLSRLQVADFKKGFPNSDITGTEIPPF